MGLGGQPVLLPASGERSPAFLQGVWGPCFVDPREDPAVTLSSTGRYWRILSIGVTSLGYALNGPCRLLCGEETRSVRNQGGEQGADCSGKRWRWLGQGGSRGGVTGGEVLDRV